MAIGLLQFAVLVLSVWQSSAWINGEVNFKYFDQCTSIYNSDNSTDLMTQRLYEEQCSNLLVPMDSSFKRIGNFSEDQMNLIRSLFRKIYNEAYISVTSRIKRDVKGGSGGRGGNGRWRFRQEVRADGGIPFQRYAAAVIRLKRNGMYAPIAAIHEVVVLTAHIGPNLLPWHRLYLLVLETALGVPIPIWDSSVDFNMKDPTASIVWTPKYFGNGVGQVVTGPFAYFSTPAGFLIRKIGADGSLISREATIKNVFSKRRFAEVTTPYANPASNFEFFHHGAHVWVNGVMGNLAISAHDPVFFCFHAYLDSMWEEFRQIQIKSGINPAKDFVKTNLIGHQPNERAHLRNFINSEGYSGKVASMVVYEFGNECPVCYNSDDIYCDSHRNVCVGKIGLGTEITGEQLASADRLAAKSGLSTGTFGATFPLAEVDPRTRGDAVQRFTT